MIKNSRVVQKKISMEDIFDKLGIPNEEHAYMEPNFLVEVKGDKGFFPVRKFFRTNIQNSATIILDNGMKLKCGHDHQVYTDRGWVKSCDLLPSDEVYTEDGKHFPIDCIVDNNVKPLYDISVEDVHSYYSNGVLSHNSWALATIAGNAARIGKRVAVYTLELNESYMGLRFDTIFTGIEPGNIPNNPDAVRKVVDSINGDIIIKYYPARSVTVHTLAAHLEHLTMNKLRPDIILVDYADLMRATTKTDARYQELGIIYEELRSFGGEYGIPVWTASQTQRCLTLDTIVETPVGNIEIGKIKEGDEVNTHLGFKKVTNVFPVEKQAVYEVTLKSGKKIKCSAKHEFPTAGGNLLSIETGLRVGEQLLTKKNTGYSTNILNNEDFVLDEIVDIRLVGEMETVDITVEDTHMFYANEIYTHNSSIQDDIIEADKISESYSKIMTADLVISLSRKLEDKANHTARAHIIKNRFGSDGVTLPVYMNTSIGKVEIYDENSSKGIMLKKQMQAGEGLLKKTLAKKLQEMNDHFDDEE